MSDPAKTLKGFFAACDYDTEKAEDAFYALLAENRRLQEALRGIELWPFDVNVTAEQDIGAIKEFARAALTATDPEAE